jgi:medium-chain acyl-[acyl-carrier-protein] hydrolase
LILRKLKVPYSRDYLIHYYEIDKNRKLTLPNLIHYFEDIAILNSAANGFSLEYYDSVECGFMLIRWDIKIYAWPSFNEKVTIKTWPSSFKRFLANRKYEVYSREGAKMTEAHSVWLFANTATRKPQRVPDEIFKGFNLPKDSEKDFYMPDDLQPLNQGEYRKKLIVQNYDIDTNNHVNNVRYVDWALISLPPDVISGYLVSDAQVSYKKELYAGDEVEIISEIQKDGENFTSVHSIHNAGKDVCNVRLEWKKLSLKTETNMAG